MLFYYVYTYIITKKVILIVLTTAFFKLKFCLSKTYVKFSENVLHISTYVEAKFSRNPFTFDHITLELLVLIYSSRVIVVILLRKLSIFAH